MSLEYQLLFQPFRNVDMKKTNICGVDCNPGDDKCNGYCTDDSIKSPADYKGKQYIFGCEVIITKINSWPATFKASVAKVVGGVEPPTGSVCATGAGATEDAAIADLFKITKELTGATV